MGVINGGVWHGTKRIVMNWCFEEYGWKSVIKRLFRARSIVH